MWQMIVAMLGATPAEGAPDAVPLPPANERLRQVGEAIFEVPEGWRAGDLDPDDGWMTIWSDLPDDRCEYCRIQVHLGAPAKGSFPGWLRERKKAMLDDDEKVSDRQPERRTAMPGGGEMRMSIRKAGRNMQFFFGLQRQDRFELISFEAPVRDIEDAQASMREHVLPMVLGMRHVGSGAKPLLGPPVPGGLDGVWHGISFYPSVGLDGSMVMRQRREVYSFYPDGRFYDGVPPRGLSSFDFAEAAAKATSDVGNYVRVGNTIHLLYADGDRDELEVDDDALVDGGTRMFKATLAEPGHRFAGTISRVNYAASPFGDGGVASSGSTEFFEDGTYVSASFVSGTGAGYVVTSKSGPKRGRYEVGEGIITMTAPDGTEDVRTFLMMRGEDGPVPLVGSQFVETD